MEAIKIWLNSPLNYDAGVELYRLYGSNATLKRVLASEAETPFKQKKLKEALAQLLQTTNAAKTHRQTVIAQHASAEAPLYTVGREGLGVRSVWGDGDPVLAALHAQWKPLYAEMKSLQHRIDDVAKLGATDRNKLLEAGQMAIRILDLEEQIADVYHQRDYYNEHGQLPMQAEKEDLPIVDPSKWGLALETNKKYMRRYAKKLKDNPASKNAPSWTAALQKATALVAEYKKLLKIDE